MVPHLSFFVANTAQTLLGVVVLSLLIRAKAIKTYWPLFGLALWQAPSYFVLLVLLYLRHLGMTGMSPQFAYQLYFYSSWPLYAVSAICSLIFSYILFSTAMRPLKGLRRLGDIVFAWVAFISVLTALSVAFAPAPAGYDPVMLSLSQLERASALITISLVAFVAIAIRPMGLSVRSRVFGTSIGTLILAFTNLTESNYLNHSQSLYNGNVMAQMIGSCVVQTIWIYYFAKPEPERNFILLPTTSPFHYWNDIARRLDQEPGMVAIGGFNPNAFAGAEVEVFRRASAKMPQAEDSSEQQPSGPG